MSDHIQTHSQAWVLFSYASFAAACALVVGGIYALDGDLWVRAYLLIGMVMLVQSSVNVTKTIRDNHESTRLINRIEDARTERLIRESADTLGDG